MVLVPIIAKLFYCLSGAKFVMAPRGEFSPGAFRLKRYKKNIYLKLFKILRIDTMLYFHGTSDSEVADIINLMKAPKEFVYCIHNVPSFLLKIHNPKDLNRNINEDECISKFRACFISRISRKKFTFDWNGT